MLHLLSSLWSEITEQEASTKTFHPLSIYFTLKIALVIVMKSPIIYISLLCFVSMIVAEYEFDEQTPLLASVMSRSANLSKPRLVIPHVTEYAGYFTLVIPIGMQMAIEGLSKMTKNLRNFEFQVDFYESYCSDEPMVNLTMALMESGINQHILPIHTSVGCPAIGSRFVGEVAHHYNFTAITTVDIVPESFDKRSRFQNFFTMGESVISIHEALITFMDKFKWKRIALLGEDHTFYKKVGFLSLVPTWFQFGSSLVPT